MHHDDDPYYFCFVLFEYHPDVFINLSGDNAIDDRAQWTFSVLHAICVDPYNNEVIHHSDLQTRIVRNQTLSVEMAFGGWQEPSPSTEVAHIDCKWMDFKFKRIRNIPSSLDNEQRTPRIDQSKQTLVPLFGGVFTESFYSGRRTSVLNDLAKNFVVWSNVGQYGPPQTPLSKESSPSRSQDLNHGQIDITL